MNIKKLCEDAHKNAVEKGFYDCPECGGQIRYRPWGDDYPEIECKACEGTGIDPNRNIGELLALICSELYEALMAHRCRKFANIETSNSLEATEVDIDWIRCFERFIKDTFEDEIADVFIRLFDLCGYLNIELEILNISGYIKEHKNVGSRIYRISHELPIIEIGQTAKSNMIYKLCYFYSAMIEFCQDQNIDIEKHIALKMTYNKTRPYKHNKEY